MANPEPAMSSSFKSGSIATNSRRHSGFAREIACAAGPVSQTRGLTWYSAGQRGSDMFSPSLLARPFSAHLFSDDPRQHAPAFGLQQGLGVDTPKQVQQRCDQTRPSCLVAGAEAPAVVTVEVLVRQDQVAPMRVILELGRPAVHRPSPLGIAQERARQPADNLLGHLE